MQVESGSGERGKMVGLENRGSHIRQHFLLSWLHLSRAKQQAAPVQPISP
jgi:hypothetical protein